MRSAAEKHYAAIAFTASRLVKGNNEVWDFTEELTDSDLLALRSNFGGSPLQYLTAAIAGEGAEVFDVVKKTVEQGRPFSREKLLDELGDVLFYTHLVCRMAGCTLDEVLERNTAKILARRPNGADG